MPSYTLENFDARLLDRVDNNTVLFTQQRRYNAINEALRVANLLTGFSQLTVQLPFPTDPYRRIYDIPQPIVFPIAVYYANRTLNRSSWYDLSHWSRTWLTDDTINYGPVNNWVPIGITKFAIHPADATGGSFLQVTGIADNTTLVNPTDRVVLQDEYVDAIADLAQSILTLELGGKPFTDSTICYQNFLRKMRDLSRWRANTAPRYWNVFEKEHSKQ